MAIADMTRLEGVALQAQKQALVAFLMEQSVMELDNAETGAYLAADTAAEQEQYFAEKQARTAQVLAYMQEVLQQKKPIFPQKRTQRPFSPQEAETLYKRVLEAEGLQQALEDLHRRRQQYRRTAASFAPWAAYPADVARQHSAYTELRLGTFAKTKAPAEILEKVKAEFATVELAQLGRDEERIYCVAACHKSEAASLQRLREHGFAPAVFAGKAGVPAKVLEQTQKDLTHLAQEENNLLAKLKSFVQDIPKWQALCDHFAVLQDEAAAIARMGRTEKTVYFCGFVPSKKAERLEKALRQHFVCEIRLTPLARGEDYPILFENNRFGRVFETITRQYDMPQTDNLDPNFIMGLFYFFFFGMMLSDAAYGLLLLLGCGFVYWRWHPRGDMGRLLLLLAVCGISTVVWGAIYGSWFGDLFGIPGLVDPMESIMPLLIFSLILGVLHIVTGMGMKAYLLIRDGKMWAALFDVGLWYGVFLGAGLLLFGVSGWPVWLAAGGLVGLVLTQGRHSKTLGGKIGGGLAALYNITGYVSDILSYSRLLALGLSTGVIANVVNLMAGMCPPGVNIVVILIGHSINLAINTLGTYVHTSRLQYVEFFSKFYEGGGRAFVPFMRRTNYVNFKEDTRR